MLRGANTDPFNSLAPKDHNIECQKPVKVNLKLNWRICTLGTNVLNKCRIRKNP